MNYIFLLHSGVLIILRLAENWLVLLRDRAIASFFQFINPILWSRNWVLGIQDVRAGPVCQLIVWHLSNKNLVESTLQSMNVLNIQSFLLPCSNIPTMVTFQPKQLQYNYNTDIQIWDISDSSDLKQCGTMGDRGEYIQLEIDNTKRVGRWNVPYVCQSRSSMSTSCTTSEQ